MDIDQGERKSQSKTTTTTMTTTTTTTTKKTAIRFLFPFNPSERLCEVKNPPNQSKMKGITFVQLSIQNEIICFNRFSYMYIYKRGIEKEFYLTYIIKEYSKAIEQNLDAATKLISTVTTNKYRRTMIVANMFFLKLKKVHGKIVIFSKSNIKPEEKKWYTLYNEHQLKKKGVIIS